MINLRFIYRKYIVNVHFIYTKVLVIITENSQMSGRQLQIYHEKRSAPFWRSESGWIIGGGKSVLNRRLPLMAICHEKSQQEMFAEVMNREVLSSLEALKET